jgi:hypothetical protein
MMDNLRKHRVVVVHWFYVGKSSGGNNGSFTSLL